MAEQPEPAPVMNAAIQAMIDTSIATAVATAVAAGMAAAPVHVPAAPPYQAAFSLYPGRVNTNKPWDYSTSQGMKIHTQSTTAITPVFTGNPWGLKVFLGLIGSRGNQYGWTKMILTIPDSQAGNLHHHIHRTESQAEVDVAFRGVHH